MLNVTEKAAALEIVLSAKSPEDCPIIDDRLCREFPSIETDDLITLWREAGARQLVEAAELEKFARVRYARGPVPQ